MKSANLVHFLTVVILAGILGVFALAPGSYARDHGEGSLDICPSQVLYLYNKDWKGHRHFVGDGYESRKAAEHYVYMRTDTETGEKPYMLGLTCSRGLGSYLNDRHLQEGSSDNTCGVVYREPGSDGTVSACGLKDSRLVEWSCPIPAGPGIKKLSGWI